MSTEFLIYENRGGDKLYLTELDDVNNPLSGIGFQSSSDGTVPSAAGCSPTEADALKVIAYLREAIGDGSEDYQIEERVAKWAQTSRRCVKSSSTCKITTVTRQTASDN